MKAFHGVVAIKKLLLQRIDTLDSVEIDGRWSNEFGIEPAFLALVNALASDLSFVRNVFGAVAPNANLLALTSGWIGWVSAEAQPPLCAMISDTDMRASAGDIVELHRRARTGRAISANDWRAARSKLAHVTGEDVELRAIQAFAASAWDMVTTAGAAADFATAWGRALAADIDAQLAWTSEHTGSLQRAQNEAWAAAREKVGAAPEGADHAWYSSKDGKDFAARLEVAKTEYETAHPFALDDLAQERSRRQREMHRKVRADFIAWLLTSGPLCGYVG